MYKIKDNNLCKDIGLSNLFFEDRDDFLKPRRKWMRYFEKWFYVFSWIGISTPIIIVMLFLILRNTYKCYFFYMGIFWLITSFIFSLSYSKSNNIGVEFRDKPWFLKIFDKRNNSFHIFISLFLIVILQLSASQGISIVQEWLWLLYIIPPMIASEEKATEGYSFVLFITIILLTGTEIQFSTHDRTNFLLVSSTDFFSILIKGSFIVAITSARHYYVRLHAIWVERSHFLQKTITRLSSEHILDNEDTTFNLEEWMTKEIKDRLSLEKVSILILDEKNDRLELIGGSGIDRENISKVHFNKNDGICGHVLNTKVTHFAPDVTRCPHYKIIDGFYDTKSELSTPIYVRDRAIGVLDIQSDQIDDFSLEDVREIVSLANVIGCRLEGKYVLDKTLSRENDELLETLIRTSNILYQDGRITTLFDDFANKLIDKLKVTSVVMYQLASGTGYPILPPITKGIINKANNLSTKTFSKDSMVFDFIIEWKPIYIRDVNVDSYYANFFHRPNPGKGLKKKFFREENIYSAAFIPMGTSDERIAALFLYYQYPMLFDDIYKLKLQALSSLYALQMLIVRQHELNKSPLFVETPDLHASIGLRFLRLRREIELASNERKDSSEVIRFVEDDLKEVMKDIFLDEGYEKESKDPYKLNRRIENYINALKQSCNRDIEFIIDIDSKVYYSGNTVSQAVYAIVCEAMLNGVHHGNANRIEVKVTKYIDCIKISIKDDGTGFDVEKARKLYSQRGDKTWKGISGIFSRLDALEYILGANVKDIKSSKNGTEVIAEIPLMAEVEHE